ncbi:hypothetical protein [Pelagibaculum spongiae]|uniref:Metalloenzyme domain-containing protein n=1 Tax=Pelagibaculum spongiae TaxID=2080658 RepID=A0A2V1GVZ6_9GAMM|nr:hypothetical protein [Pelagibaculum spongiae]PVZ68128.1 hypothetical protein DC094_12540 [Pelagibaculum spongiae]
MLAIRIGPYSKSYPNKKLYVVNIAFSIGCDAEAFEGGMLSDVAPTMLSLMGLNQPAEMTGKPLMLVK